MAWRGYHYVLGMFLLVPTAILLTMVWAWRRIRGGWELKGGSGETRQLRQGTSEEFTIPAEAVGYVIGRQGQRVREMERTSGARIRFKDQQDSEDKVRLAAAVKPCSFGGVGLFTSAGFLRV